MTVLLSTGPLYLTAKYGLYKNKDEIQIVSPKLYEWKYFKHYHGGSWHSWDGEIIWWFYNHGPLFVKLIILAVFIFCIMTVNNYYKGKHKKDCDCLTTIFFCNKCVHKLLFQCSSLQLETAF